MNTITDTSIRYSHTVPGEEFEVTVRSAEEGDDYIVTISAPDTLPVEIRHTPTRGNQCVVRNLSVTHDSPFIIEAYRSIFWGVWTNTLHLKVSRATEVIHLRTPKI
jgi:hypothetical protein